VRALLAVPLGSGPSVVAIVGLIVVLSCVLERDHSLARPGAKDLCERGIFSSLQPSNLRLRRAISRENQLEARDHPMYPLLFDPQTAGGLLATVPAKSAAKCVAELKKLGYGR
jgi:selenide,water dikinase